MKKTIAIDFDGVIHAYSKGWQDGKIYDPPIKGSIEFLNKIMSEKNYSVFILSTRSPLQIKSWLLHHSNSLLYMSQSDFQDQFLPMLDYDNNYIMAEYEDKSKLQYKLEVIPWWKFWVKFWNKSDIIGITQKKLAAVVYIDDRALKFSGDWNEIKESL